MGQRLTKALKNSLIVFAFMESINNEEYRKENKGESVFYSSWIFLNRYIKKYYYLCTLIIKCICYLLSNTYFYNYSMSLKNYTYNQPVFVSLVSKKIKK